MKTLAYHLRKERRRRNRYRILVLVIDLSLSILGLKKTNRLINFFSKSKKHTLSDDEASLDRIVSAFNHIKEHRFMKGKCLSQSLAMQFVLSRFSIKTDLIIGGTFQSDSPLLLHAWLEREGVVINDHPYNISRYKVLLSDTNTPMLKV